MPPTILNYSMGTYMCSNCGNKKTTMSTSPTLEMKCCKGEDTVTHDKCNPGDTFKGKTPAKVVAPKPLDTSVGNALPAPPIVDNPSNQPINASIRAGLPSPVGKQDLTVGKPGELSIAGQVAPPVPTPAPVVTLQPASVPVTPVAQTQVKPTTT